MASRANRDKRGGGVPNVANSALPQIGSYCSKDSVPHIGNAVAIPGGNKAKRMAPKNSVALKGGKR